MTVRHVVVVGAGPAGLVAAEAALGAGARVTLIDSADQPGGQYHRMLPEAYDAARPERLQHGWRAFDRRRRRVLAHPRCTWWSQTSVWALERPDAARPGVSRVHVLRGPADGGGRHRATVDPDALVLGCGAWGGRCGRAGRCARTQGRRPGGRARSDTGARRGGRGRGRWRGWIRRALRAGLRG
ncbi:FAD-dependent oxidoreductase [Streptomyces sp. NPDC056821]